MVYTFGNSHSHLFTNSAPGTSGVGENSNNLFTSISLGPVIAYNFFEHHYESLINWINTLSVDKENDYIMLIVGEVDCRVHLPTQIISQNRDVDDVVNECVNRFFRVYKDLKEKGYNIIGWGGHPSTTSGPDTNASSPVVGECEFRNKISLSWDKRLRYLCEEEGIPYISIIEDLINNNNLTKMEYFMDYCHLKHENVLTLLQEKFNKHQIKII